MPGPRRPSAPLLVACLVAVALVAGALFAACRGGGSDDGGGARPAPDPTVDVTLAVGDVRVESTGAPVPFPDAIRDAVMTTVRNYVSAATVGPLQTGRAGDLAPLFTAAAAARVSAPGPDRDTLVDEGVPTVAGDITAENAPVTLVGLAGGDGAVVLVSAAVSLVVRGEAAGGLVEVRRNAQLVLTDDGGQWKIDGWDAGVERTTPTAPTTTTKASR